MDEELLERIDDVIKTSPDLKPERRFTRKRSSKLRKLQKDTRAYRDNLTNILLTIRGMEKALEQEAKTLKAKI